LEDRISLPHTFIFIGCGSITPPNVTGVRYIVSSVTGLEMFTLKSVPDIEKTVLVVSYLQSAETHILKPVIKQPPSFSMYSIGCFEFHIPIRENESGVVVTSL
jgi:hypothetical protein